MAKLLCPECKSDCFEIYGWEGWKVEYNINKAESFDKCKTRSYLIQCKKCGWKKIIEGY